MRLDVILDLLFQLLGGLGSLCEDDRGLDHLSADGVRGGGHAAFEDVGKLHDDVLDLKRTDAVARRLDDVVDAADVVEIAVLVAPRHVSRVIHLVVPSLLRFLLVAIVAEEQTARHAERATGTLASTLGADNPLRYRSYYYDIESGLYYLQSRYYDPELGRFINADSYTSTGQGILGNNMFTYCGNNPVGREDDGGEFWNVVVGAVIGAVVNTVVSYAASTMAGEEFSLADAGVAFASGAIAGAVAATGLGALGQAVVGGAVGFGGSVVNNVLEGEDISWESAAINGIAGFAGGLIGGNGIRKTGGKLDVAKKALDYATTLKNSGAKMVRNTVTKNLQKAAATYAEVYATESLITLGRFYAGAWGAAIISKGGAQLWEK